MHLHGFFLFSESNRLKYKSFLSECCLQQWQQYSCSLSADVTYFLLQNPQRGRIELSVSGGRSIRRLEANCLFLITGFHGIEFHLFVFRGGGTAGMLDSKLLFFVCSFLITDCDYLSANHSREMHAVYEFPLFTILYMNASEMMLIAKAYR